MLTLYDPATLRIEAYIREAVAVGLKTTQTLEADIEALHLTVPAIIEEIVPAANPDARNFLVKMQIGNRTGLYPGLFIRIRIPQGEEQILAIPQSLIRKVGQLDVVWLVKNGQIERRFIRLGRPLSDGRIKIVSGLGVENNWCRPKKHWSQSALSLFNIYFVGDSEVKDGCLADGYRPFSSV